MVQSTCGPDLNAALMELLLLLHTARLSGARRVTAVVPFLAYARQDRQTRPGVPISASAVAQLIQAIGVDRLVTVDLHCGQIQGFFRNLPVDNLCVDGPFVRYLKGRGFDPETAVVVSPDAGGVERATRVANLLYARHVVTILKRRTEASKVHSMQMVGEVRGYTCYVIDDMVDTGCTLVGASNLLRARGACDVVACVTHGIFSGDCCETLERCEPLREVVVTDSIPQQEHQKRCSKLKVLPLGPLLAETVRRINSEQSVADRTAVFNQRNSQL